MRRNLKHPLINNDSNDSKTELMLVTSKQSKHLHNLPTFITMGNAQIHFKQSVKNLDFTLDYHLTVNAHVSNIAWTCYIGLRLFILFTELHLIVDY